MKKHQVVAIIVGTILSIVSFFPVLLTINKYKLEDLGHPNIVGVFLYPTIGVSIAAIIIFISFFKKGSGE